MEHEDDLDQEAWALQEAAAWATAPTRSARGGAENLWKTGEEPAQKAGEESEEAKISAGFTQAEDADECP